MTMNINLIESIGLPVLRSAESMLWRDQAACRGQHPEMFLPEGKFPVGSADYKVFVARAFAFCEACPVLDECLQFGMTQKLGIYGKTTSSNRAAMRKQNRAFRVVNVIGEK
jgi:WhiB family redox-sensing transcriptional regulator